MHLYVTKVEASLPPGWSLDLNPVFVTGAKGEPKTETSGTVIMKHELSR